MNELTDSVVTPVLLFLSGWSLRWAVLILLIGFGMVVLRPRPVATRLLIWRLAFIGGLFIPLLPQCWGPTIASAPRTSTDSRPDQGDGSPSSRSLPSALFVPSRVDPAVP